jgi:MFS family permease
MPTAHARRNVLLLALCQALFMTCTSAIVTSIALTGHLLAENKALATLPVALQFATHMAVTIPASLYMRRFGRQVGFLTGTLIGAIGALTAAYAILEASFTLFCLGSAILGGFNSIAQFYRFAAADSSDEIYRSRAISLVLAGGVIASLTGPTLARHTNDLFSPVMFAGTYVAVVGVQALIACVVLMIRIPRPTISERRAVGRPFLEIARQPTFLVAVLGSVVGYVVMSFLMTVTPIAMAECNFTFGDSAFVIQGHVLGMFAPSFFTGHLIARFGAVNVMTAGAVLLAGAIGTSLSG